MTYSREISSSDTADEQYISIGGELSLSNLGQKELLLAMAEKGAALRTTARGFSMQPFIRDRDILTIAPMNEKKPVLGDVVAFIQPHTGRLALHRIIGQKEKGWIIKGDNCLEPDGIVPDEKIIGYITRVERDGSEVRLAIGQMAKLIAILNRGKTLLRLIKILYLPRRVVNYCLRIFR